MNMHAVLRSLCDVRSIGVYECSHEVYTKIDDDFKPNTVLDFFITSVPNTTDVTADLDKTTRYS